MTDDGEQGRSPSPEDPELERTLGMRAQISRAMVNLYKEQFGRGPTRARTHWCGDDMIVCVLEESLTSAEKNLQRMGEHQRLRDVRMFFQYATVTEFCEPVERFTGRKVRAFISGLDANEDVAIETFMLHPEGYEGPGRADESD